MSYLPVVVLAAAGVAVLVDLVFFARRDVTGVSFVSAVLVGLGGLLVYGTVNTLASCIQTEGFCGQANVLPLASTAIAILVVGLAGGLWAYTRANRG